MPAGSSYFSSKKNQKYSFIFAVIFTVAILGTYLIDIQIDRRHLINEAIISAVATYNKDFQYRSWNNVHGGVYVPVTEYTPPNPFLDVPNRDITDQNGTALTLINPAYMTRQVHEMSKDEYGFRGHITSLNPIRPQNAPDPWEANVLNLFDKGVQEVISEEILDDQPYLRFMRPMITEKQCLKCHGKQGYKEGEIRGGISVSIPLSPYFAIYSEHKRFSAWMYFLIWLSGITFLFYLSNNIIKQRKIKEEAEQQRKQTEKQLVEQNYYLEKAQELGQIGTWELDIINNILLWTDENCRIFGVPEGSVADYEIFVDKVHPDDREYVDREWKASIDGKPYDIEHRLLIDGKVKWVREKADIEFNKEGTAVKAIGVTQDITVRKMVEESVKKSEEQLRHFIQETPAPVAMFDRNMCYIAASSRWISDNHLDISNTDIIGLSHYEVFPEIPEYFKETHKRGMNGEISRADEESFKRTDGTIQWTMWEVRPWYKTDDSVGGIIILSEDITNRKQEEAKRLELEKQLSQAQRMESIGTLAGGIAHDFNNILSPIMLHTEMMMDDLPSDDPLQDAIKEINMAGMRARDLVQQILTFARKKSEEKIVLKLSTVVKEAIKFLRSTIPTTIDIQYNLETGQDMVLADPTQLNQIVMNLCTNAAHAMREKGGLLELNLSNEYIAAETSDGKLRLKQGKYLKLSVRDSGKGIPPENIDRIFEPYFTTKGPGEGTGLGLAIIHGILQNYGGDINVETKVDEGTTFNVYLPSVENLKPLSDKQDVEIPKGTERILMVDDEKAILDVTKKMLIKLGYKVTAIASSIEALEIFRSSPESFDLIVTDMTMPNMTGKELAIQSKKIRDIPVILCTGFSDQVDEHQAKEVGIEAFILKPVSKQEIANAVRKVLYKK